jgi:hypothetical protein
VKYLTASILILNSIQFLSHLHLSLRLAVRSRHGAVARCHVNIRPKCNLSSEEFLIQIFVWTLCFGPRGRDGWWGSGGTGWHKRICHIISVRLDTHPSQLKRPIPEDGTWPAFGENYLIQLRVQSQALVAQWHGSGAKYHGGGVNIKLQFMAWPNFISLVAFKCQCNNVSVAFKKFLSQKDASVFPFINFLFSCSCACVHLPICINVYSL